MTGHPIAYLVELQGAEEPVLSGILGGLMALGLGVLAMRLKTKRLERFSVVALLLAPASSLYCLSTMVDEGRLVYEVLLPLACLGFVGLSIKLQRKGLLYSGAGYLIVATLQITQNHFTEEARWPFALVAVGLVLAVLSLFGGRALSGLRMPWKGASG